MFTSSAESISTATAFPLATRRALDRIGIAFTSFHRAHLGLEGFRYGTLPIKLCEGGAHRQCGVYRDLCLARHELRNSTAVDLEIAIGSAGQRGGIGGPNLILHNAVGREWLVLANSWSL